MVSFYYYDLENVGYAPELPNPDDIKRGYADAEFDTALEAAAG